MKPIEKFTKKQLIEELEFYKKENQELKNEILNLKSERRSLKQQLGELNKKNSDCEEKIKNIQDTIFTIAQWEYPGVLFPEEDRKDTDIGLRLLTKFYILSS